MAPKAHDEILSAIGHEGKANQNHNEVPLHTHKKGVDEDVGKPEPLYIAGKDVKWYGGHGVGGQFLKQ